jgi:drug/metabolite transporter (DMT)-like permease
MIGHLRFRITLLLLCCYAEALLPPIPEPRELFDPTMLEFVTEPGSGQALQGTVEPVHHKAMPIRTVASELLRMLETGSTMIKPEVKSSSTHLAVIYALGFMMVISVTPVLKTHGFRAFTIVVVYLTSLTLVQIFIKQAVMTGFRYPYIITALHMLSTAVVAFICDPHIPRYSDAMQVLSISLVNGLVLTLSNSSLLYGGVAFCSIIGSCTPASTFALEVAMGRRQLFRGLLPVILVCLGAIFCINGDANSASFLCFCLSAGSALLRSVRSIWQHQLLQNDIPPLRMAFWSGFWIFLGIIPLIVCTEGPEAFDALLEADHNAVMALMISSVAATALNVSQVFALQTLGPLLQAAIGNLNLIMVIALAVALLGEQMTRLQCFGAVVLGLGAILLKMNEAENHEKNVLESLPMLKDKPAKTRQYCLDI